MKITAFHLNQSEHFQYNAEETDRSDSTYIPWNLIVLVLGIETSCDETAVALYDQQRGLLAQSVHTQIELHRNYGGVVPELASRDHIQMLCPLIKQLLQQVNITYAHINAIAYTAGPGLGTALAVGTCFAKSLAWSLGIPAIGIHHMEAHLLSIFLEEKKQHPAFPFLALLISGGHTQLVHAVRFGTYKLLGETLDDAAGEAFDKVAKLLGLPYPGGPSIAQAAEYGRSDCFQFPRPMTQYADCRFSFSGLKTAVRTQFLASRPSGKTYLSQQDTNDIAASFQAAVVDTLVWKSKYALQTYGLKRLVMAGGVASNIALRASLKQMTHALGARLFYPKPAFCTDNAAMIAYTGLLRLQAGDTEPFTQGIRIHWPMERLALETAS